MRERLVTAFVGLAVLLVALYGIPRAYFLAEQVRSQEQDRVDRTAALVAVALEQHTSGGGQVDAAFLDALAAHGETITLRPTDGAAVMTTDHTEGELRATAVVPSVGTVKVTRDDDAVDDEVAQAILPLVLLGLGLVAVAGGLGFWLARRLSRPFTELAEAAGELGAGARVDLPEYRVPEARAIARALTTSAERLEVLLSHERELAVHASHELRTPVTALRLELEDLALRAEGVDGVSDSLRHAVAELDRLAAAIDDLLASTRDVAASTEIDLDLDALLADTAARLTAAGRTVHHRASQPLPTRIDPDPVVRSLEALALDGSTLEATDRGSHLEVRLAPAGADADAATLVTASGGQLTRVDDGVVVRVPKRPLAGS